MIGRLFKFIIGVALVPACAVSTLTLVRLICSLQPETDSIFPAAGLAMAAGFGLWLLVFLFLPRTARTYVLAHELTHALWGSLMGARIHRIHVARDAGSVTLSKTNFLITLAPYFFPLYTALVVAIYFVSSFFTDVERYYLLWLGLVGLTWGFHITFTITTLMQHQSDIREGGHLFSYTVIYLFNVLGITLWIVLVSAATLSELLGFLAYDSRVVISFLWNNLKWLMSR